MIIKTMLKDYLELAKEEGSITFAPEGFKQLYNETHRALNQLEAEKSGAFVAGAVAGGVVLGTVGMAVGIVMGQNN